MTGPELRALRERLGLTQAALAEALGYPGGRNVIWRKEAGRQPVTERDAKMLAMLMDAQARGLALRCQALNVGALGIP